MARTKNFADVIRQKLAADPDLAAAVEHEQIIADFLSDEYGDATVLTALGAKYGTTNVAAALRAELRAAREAVSDLRTFEDELAEERGW